MNLNQLRAQRHDVFCASEKLIKAVKASGKDLEGADLEQHRNNIIELKRLDADIAKCESYSGGTLNPGCMFGGSGRPTGSAETWKDDRGRTVPVLAKDQSYALAVESHERASFGFGDFIQALVMPTKNHDIRAALSESGGIATGDVTVPVTLLPELIDLMRAKTVCIQAGALTVPIETETTNIARVAADPTPAWRNEAAAFAIADPTFERVQFKPQSLGVLVKVSQEILED